MKLTGLLAAATIAAGGAIVMAAASPQTPAAPAAAQVAVDSDDIGGVVTGAKGLRVTVALLGSVSCKVHPSRFRALAP